MVAGPTYWANQASGFSQASLGSAQQAGVAFQVSTSYTVVSLGYRRAGDGSQYKADTIRLWRTSDGALLGTVTVPTTETTGGWHFYDLDTPVTLDTSHTYIVTIYSLAGQTQDYLAADGPSTVGSPLVKVSAAGRYSSSTTYPDNTTTAFAWTADVSDQSASTTTGGGGITTGDLDSGLAEWLSNSASVNTHQSDGLPWQTKLDTADIRTKVTNGLNLAGGLQALSDSLAHTLQMASDWFASGSSTIFTDLKNRVLGASGGGGSAFYGPGGTQVSEGVETLLARTVDATGLGAEIAKLREELTLSPDLADTSRWTLVDTVTGVGDALVELQADLYRVSIGDAVGTHGPPHVAGVEWRPRWGWVAPRIHGCYLQRQPLVDLSPIAVAPGLFMDGLLLYSHPGFTWTVEAFVLDRT